jgi:hypothetical protein
LAAARIRIVAVPKPASAPPAFKDLRIPDHIHAISSGTMSNMNPGVPSVPNVKIPSAPIAALSTHTATSDDDHMPSSL